MATIGTLSVIVDAKTDKLSRGMKSARKEVSGFGTAVDKARGMLLGFGSALAGGFTVSILKQTIADLENMADAAERLGTSVKTLGGLSHSAFMADVSQSQLVRGLTLMEKNVANNAAGLQKLGLNLEWLRRQDAGEMFIQIAEAINKMPTAAERTAAAMSVFGKSGGELMELLAKGRAGIAADMEEAALFGLIPTEAEIQRAKQAEDAMKRLAQAWKGLKTQLAIDAAPAASGIAKNFTELLSDPWKNQRPFLLALKDLLSMTEKWIGLLNKANELTGGSTNSTNYSHLLWIQSRQAELDDYLNGRSTQPPAAKPKRFDWELWDVLSDTAKHQMSSIGQGPDGAWSDRNMPAAPKMLIPAPMPRYTTPMLGEMTDAQIGRVENRISEYLLSRMDREVVKSARPETTVSSLSALEKGSAEAFSQSRRSSQSGQLLDVSKQQLKESQMQTKALNRIDQNLRSSSGATVAANLA